SIWGPPIDSGVLPTCHLCTPVGHTKNKLYELTTEAAYRWNLVCELVQLISRKYRAVPRLPKYLNRPFRRPWAPRFECDIHENNGDILPVVKYRLGVYEQRFAHVHSTGSNGQIIWTVSDH
ncbi:unnamed protein product, partial [Sphacelaria rigidula]